MRFRDSRLQEKTNFPVFSTRYPFRTGSGNKLLCSECVSEKSKYSKENSDIEKNIWEFLECSRVLWTPLPIMRRDYDMIDLTYIAMMAGTFSAGFYKIYSLCK